MPPSFYSKNTLVMIITFQKFNIGTGVQLNENPTEFLLLIMAYLTLPPSITFI